jgi:uncharacterized protein YndB with AHSA1/START domain
MVSTFFEPEAIAEPTPAVAPTHDIVHELFIAAEPSAVYDALTTPTGLARWWDTRCTDALVEGEQADLPIGDEPVVARVEMAEAPEVVSWTFEEGPREWVGTSVAVRIEPVPSSVSGTERPVCAVRLWHGGWAYEDGLLPRASFEWAMALDRLRRTCESPS